MTFFVSEQIGTPNDMVNIPTEKVKNKIIVRW